jgi:cobaltochelatase CobS
MPSVSNLEAETVEEEVTVEEVATTAPATTTATQSVIEEIAQELGLDNQLSNSDQGYKIIVEDLPDFKRVLWESLKYRPVTIEMLEDHCLEEGSNVWLNDSDNPDTPPALGTVTSVEGGSGAEWSVQVSLDVNNTDTFKFEMLNMSGKEELVGENSGLKLRTDNYLLHDVKPSALQGGETRPSQVYIYRPEVKKAFEFTLVNVGARQGNEVTLDGSVIAGVDSSPVDTTNFKFKNINRSILTKDHVEAIVKGLEDNGRGTVKKGNVVKSVSLDAASSTAINSMLKDTGLTIQSLLKGHNQSKETFFNFVVEQRNSRQINKKLEDMVSDLRNKTAASTFLPPQVSFDPNKSSGTHQRDYPQGEVDWKYAYDVFKVPPRYKDTFNFQVPVWSWFKEDASGVRTPAKHPLVPDVSGDYIFNPKTLPTILWALGKNRKAWISGHTGTGKSSLIEEIAALTNYPLIRINFDSEITRMDLIGRDVLTQENGTTISKFEDGILPQALQQPCILLCDEIDFIRPDIAYVMQRALEDKGLLITEDGGRLIEPHPYCRIVATANTQGQGDDFGYQGARTQSMAFLDRFTVWADMDYLTKSEETKLIKSRVPDLLDDYTSQVLDYVQEHRTAFINGDISQPISPRGVIALCEAIVTFTSLHKKPVDGLNVAIDSTVLNKANPQDRQVLRGIVDRMFDFDDKKTTV